MQGSESSKDTSYLRMGVLPKLASGSLRWMGVESPPCVVSPLLLHLLLLHLLHGAKSLAGLSLPSLGRLDVRVQRLLHVDDSDVELAHLLREGDP